MPVLQATIGRGGAYVIGFELSPAGACWQTWSSVHPPEPDEVNAIRSGYTALRSSAHCSKRQNRPSCPDCSLRLGTRMFRLISFVVAAIVPLTCAASAATMRNFKVGDWFAGAYSNDSTR